MAKFMEMTPEQEQLWKEWVQSKPPHIQEIIHRLPADRLYKLKTSKHLVTIRSYDEGENGEISLTVTVSAKYNLVAFERNVFGVKPENLEECDLPDDNHPVGDVSQMTGISPDEIIENFKKATQHERN